MSWQRYFHDGTELVDFRNRVAVLLLVMLTVIVPPIPVSGAATFSTDLSITKGDAVKISNIDDWDFGVFSSDATTTTALRFFDETCVFSSTGAYSLQVSSQNGGTRLRLLNGAGDEMRYRIRLRLLIGNNLRNRTFNNSVSTLSGLAASSALDCSDQGARDWNLRFRPTIGRNVFNNAPPGVYTDVDHYRDS